MSNNAEIGVSNRALFTQQQKLFLDEIILPETLRLYNSHALDSKSVDIANSNWRIDFGGYCYSFQFNHFTKHEEVFIKWILVKFLRSYQPRYSYRLYLYFKYLITDFDFDFSISNLMLRLKSLVNQTDAMLFCVFKRLGLTLCEFEFGELQIDDVYKFEGVFHNSRHHWDSYYAVDVKFKPDLVRFLRNGLARDYNRLEQLNESELISICTLALCFETGLRPVQLYRLTDTDLIEYGDGFYSLKITMAKQSKLISEQEPHTLLSISPETGAFVKRLINLRKYDKSHCQLLRKENGTEQDKSNFQYIINAKLRTYASPEQQDHIPVVTIYDFRHNVGHSLAMSGASAEEIAYVLGHTSTVAARHYISATPEIARLKQKALGENAAYLEMMGMIMTGEIGEEKSWRGKKVAGQVDSQLFIGIGGCAVQNCDFSPVRSCYGCPSYHPFVDSDHKAVRNAIQNEIKRVIAVSDSTGQTGKNPVITEHEGTLFEVDSVIRRCELYKEAK